MRRIGSEARAFVMALCRQGNVAQARKAFEEIQEERDVVLWTVVISANARFGDYRDALKLFYRMQLDGVLPNQNTFWALLRSCCWLQLARRIHAWSVLCSCDKQQMVRKALIRAYGRCRSLRDAEQVFSHLGTDVERDVVLWTTMIAAYAQNGQSQAAMQLFQRMQLCGLPPDYVTFLAILESCSRLRDVKMAHLCIEEKGLDSLVIVGNCLVTVYARCGCLEGASRAFSKLAGNRDVVSWNSMLTALAQYSQSDKVLELYEEMKLAKAAPTAVTFVLLLEACSSLEVGRSLHDSLLDAGFGKDVIVGSTLVMMYARCGSLGEAKAVFEQMIERDVVVWTTIIAACSSYGAYADALTYFRRMLQENAAAPNEITMLRVLHACGCLPSLRTGRLLHSWIEQKQMQTQAVVTALVGMYGKCGSLQDVSSLFELHRGEDVVMWNTSIASFAQHGHTQEALSIFERMQLEGVNPDGITFVVMLSTFSHEGLLLRACGCYESMSKDYGIAPSVAHCGCMTDVLGRVGWLDEAKGFIEGMETEANATVWSSLLSACKVHGDTVCGQGAAKQAMQEQEPGPYVLLSHIYTQDVRDK